MNIKEGQLGVEIENYESYLNISTHRGILHTVSFQGFSSFSIFCVPSTLYQHRNLSLITPCLGNLKSHRQRTEVIYWKMPRGKNGKTTKQLQYHTFKCMLDNFDFGE